MAYIPKIGGAASASFPLQFPNDQASILSLATTPIHLLSNDSDEKVLGHGTGFPWKSGQHHFLVTARHVLSGTEPFLDEPTSDQGYFPKKIRIFPCWDNPSSTSRSAGIVLDLYQDDVRLWLEDPLFATLRTDIAALKLDLKPPTGFSLVEANRPGNLSPVVSFAGADCLIVGYPRGDLFDMMTPLWRRAVISSEPGLPIDGKPMFLIDATTSPGFSGSLVLRRHTGPAPVRDVDGTISVLMDRIITTDIIGVYAGRLKHQHYGGEIPFAFYANRIEKILTQIP